MAIVVPVPEGQLEPRHQLAKLILGSVAGFATNQLVGKAYDAALLAYRAKQAVSPS